MRVAIFVGVFPCLSETFILDQIIGLLNNGHDVQIIAVNNSTEEIQQPVIAENKLLERFRYLKADGIKRSARVLECLSDISSVASPPRLVRTVRRCWPFTTKKREFAKLLSILNDDFDIVHCHFGPQGADAVEAREILGRDYPVVTSFHGSDMKPSAGSTRYDQLFVLGDAFIANTNYTKTVIGQLGCHPGKIKILPVGINLDSNNMNDVCVSTDETLNVITVARLVPFKGIEFAIKAMERLIRSGRKVTYKVIGAGPLQNELARQINDLGLSNAVTLVGPKTREEVFNTFKQSDVFLLPSIEFEGRAETQGLVLQEAQAVGLPVVASRVGGIPEGLSKQNQQFLFAPGNVDELVDRLQLADDLRKQWPDIAKESQRFVRENYDNDLLVSRLESIYEQCIETSQELAHVNV